MDKFCHYLNKVNYMYGISRMRKLKKSMQERLKKKKRKRKKKESYLAFGHSERLRVRTKDQSFW